MKPLKVINYKIFLIGIFIVIATGIVIVPAVFLLTGSFSSGMPLRRESILYSG